jgi:hypothetical protein
MKEKKVEKCRAFCIPATDWGDRLFVDGVIFSIPNRDVAAVIYSTIAFGMLVDFGK